MECVEPDDAVTRQAISMGSQVQSILITNDPLIPIIPQNRPVATQDNCISNEEQHATAIQFFGPSAKRAQITPSVTTTNILLQQTLFTVWQPFVVFSLLFYLSIKHLIFFIDIASIFDAVVAQSSIHDRYEYPVL